MKPIRHHPEDDVFVKYIAGQYDTAYSLVLATHISQCVKCQNTVALQQEIGGQALTIQEPVRMDVSALDLLERAKPEESLIDQTQADKSERFGIQIPAILNSFLGKPMDKIKWQRISPFLKQHVLEVDGKATARLLWMAPGKATAPHGHSGEEMTMILCGGYYDGDEAFTKGDLHIVDHAAPHMPVAMKDGPCLVLAATDSPLLFSGILPKLLQPIFRI